MNARVRSVVAGAWACVGIGLAACGGDGGGTNPGSSSVAKANPSGDAQTGTVGAALANPLRVVVMEDGAPAAGVTVAWSIVSGGGSVNPTTATTGADGIATTTWTVGTASGAKMARATVAGFSGSPINFTATANPGPAETLEIEYGDPFAAVTGSNTPNALSVKVEDEFGNAVTGTSVAWTVESGTATVSAPNVATSALGFSRVGVGVPQAGASVIHATVAGLTGSPIAFDVSGVNLGATVDVQVLGTLAFNPNAVTISVGDQIRWTLTNTPGLQHNVTSTGATTFTSSGTLSGNGTQYTVPFLLPGTYTYQCTFHVGMNGTITVQ